MTTLALLIIGVVVVCGLIKAGADRLFNHVDDPAAARRDETTPPKDAP